MIQEAAVSALEMGGALAVALGLIEVLKVMASKLARKNGIRYSEVDRSKLQDLHTWHRPDMNGIQQWKNWGAAEAREDFLKLIILQEKTLETLKRIEANSRKE